MAEARTSEVGATLPTLKTFSKNSRKQKHREN